MGHLTSAVFKNAVLPVTDGGALEGGDSLKRADPVPAPTSPPASASLCHAAACFATPPFLLCHLTSDVADDATVTAASAAGTLATPPSSDVNVDADEDATASAASAAAVRDASAGTTDGAADDTQASTVTDGTIRRRGRLPSPTHTVAGHTPLS